MVRDNVNNEISDKHIPNIKICGIRDSDTITKMNGLSISEIGLMFAKSKRQVSIEQAIPLVEASKQILTRNGERPKLTGVVVNLSLTAMIDLLDKVDLDIIQLHGQESVDYVEMLSIYKPTLEIWKVVSIAADQDAMKDEQVEQQLDSYRNYISSILLDAPGGGTGKTFNWEAIEIYQQWAKKRNKRLIVAGGLHESNVTQLISQYELDGIDVSSGVETDGVKDIKKIEQFVRKVIEA